MNTKKKNSTQKSVSKEFVREKCQLLTDDLVLLGKLVASMPVEKMLTDPEKSAQAERWFERIVTRAIDINFHQRIISVAWLRENHFVLTGKKHRSCSRCTQYFGS